MTTPRKQKKPTYTMPFWGKILYPVQLLAFVAVMGLYYLEGLVLWLGVIALIGLIPSVMLYLLHRDYLKDTKPGKQLYHRTIAYLVAFGTTIVYLLLLLRADEYGAITKWIAAPAIILIYYSMYVNLEGRGRS